MIGYLKGKVVDYDVSSVVLLMGDGVGYKVNTPYVAFLVGAEEELFIHTNMKENSLELYGFKTREERRMFELLIGVSGIGPKSAITILGQLSIGQIVDSISMEKPQQLKVSGVGLKTAEKIIIELRNKVEGFEGGSVNEGGVSNNVVLSELEEVLGGLGYSQREVASITPKLDLNGSLQELIKQALILLKRA